MACQPTAGNDRVPAHIEQPLTGIDTPLHPTYDLTFREVSFLDDGTPFIVNPNLLRAGGPPKDGIPSIDTPQFVSVQEANEWMSDDELVLVLQYQGIKRVYPLHILVWHELVNDVVAGDALLITWCPLCGSAIAFDRTVNGEVLEFGVSGKLFNSNLVMYDRNTDTYWSQIDGIAIIGELTSTQLENIPVDVVEWSGWRDAHPDSEVLSRDTGHSRRYGNDPYGGYYVDSRLIFPVENTDDRLHPKDVVFGIEVDGVFAAFREDALKREGVVEGEVNGVLVRAIRDDIGIVDITREDTREVLGRERDFWFAWLAFHPETLVFPPVQ